mmetsp:Transcript_93459/g.157094  ORF Transcript_93459/g.157094 Transcript_93459/m.157094 type:complete len:378 (+) Transcript_93459:30-1163(+)
MGGSSSKPQQVKQTPVGPQPTYHQARSQGLPQGNPYVQPAYYTGHGAKKAPVYYAAPQPYAVRPTSYYAAPAYRAPVVAPTYGYAPRPAAPVVATSQSSALALDAADGVIDGKFYGSPVGVSAPTYAAPAPVTYAAPAYVAPTYAAPVVAGTQSSALALDAADGVIDGKYFGSQVAVAAPTYAAPATYAPATYAPAAYAAPTYAAPAPVTYAAPTYAAPVVAGTQSSALALDAADGVIDGKYFGSQVAVAAPSYVPPATFAAPTYAAPATVAAPVAYAAPATYAAPSYTSPVVAGSQSSALALDAADGVIDGKYYGSQVAVASPATYMAAAPAAYAPVSYGVPTTAFASSQASALALDAADGVVDGRFYGAPVAVRR